MPAGEVGIGGSGAHLGADVLWIGGEQIRVVARVEGSPVLALQPIAVVGSKAKRHGVLLGAVRRERRAWALGGVLPPDPVQVQHAQQAALGALARGDRLEGVVVGIRAERELQRPAYAPGSPGARGDMPPDRQRPLARRVDVRVPVRRAELGGGGHLARLDQRGRRPDVGPPIPVLGGPVGVGGVGRAARVAGPLVGHARRLGLRDHGARGVHHHLADLVRRQPTGNRSRVARVERRGLHHRQHARLERRRARGAVPLNREDVVGPEARHVASGPEGVGIRALRVLGQGVPGEDVVVQHPVGVIHRVEVVGVEREEHPVAVRVVDGVTGEARVRVGDDHRADHARAGVGGVDDGGRELVASPHGLRTLLDRHDPAFATHAHPGVVVVGLADQVRDQARRVAVGRVVRLGVIGVPLDVPAADVVRIAVSVVVEATARRTGAQVPGGDPAVPEHRDQVLRGQIWRLDAAHIDLVQVGVLAVRHAAPRRALLMARERARAGRALRVHTRVERVIADVEAPVLVEVVPPSALAVPKLGIRQLAPVQVDVV